MNTGIKRIPKNEIPCKFFKDWWEDVAGDGGSRMHMSECECDVEDCEEDIAIENGKPCNTECHYYKPVPVSICEKHNQEFYDYCGDCEGEINERF